jgi:hypothetical protein
MKNFLILPTFLITSFVSGQKRFPEYKLQNERLLKTIQLFTDSIDIVYKKTGIIVIDFKKSKVETVFQKSEPETGAIAFDLKSGSKKIDLIFEIYSTALGVSDFMPPAGYFFFNGRPYLIHTGLEALTVQPSKSAIRHLNRKLKKFIVSGQGRHGPIWGIHLTNDKLEILFRYPDFRVKLDEGGSR